MGLFSFLFGKKPKYEQTSPYTSEQQRYLDSILGTGAKLQPQVQEFLSQLLGGGGYDRNAISENAIRRFNQDIIPSLAEGFTGFLGEGANRGSPFSGQVAQAGANLAGDLAQSDYDAWLNRQQLGLGALGALGGYTAPGLGQRTQTNYTPGTPGLFGSLLGPVGQGIGGGLSMGIGTGIANRLGQGNWLGGLLR